jgi:hypothetical protein
MSKPFQPKNLPLTRFEKKLSPKNGLIDEGLIEEIIIRIIKPFSHFCIEFGAGNGVDHSNVRNLIARHGFGALLIDANDRLAKELQANYRDNPDVKTVQAFIYAETIESLFEANGVPAEPDLLVIDIDGNDYHVWKSITRYRPRVVIIEYNPSYLPGEYFVKEYEPDFVWNGDDYYNASITPLVELGKEKGYSLIHCVTGGDNLYFVRDDLFHLFDIPDNSPEAMYQLPDYGRFGRVANGRGHPASVRNTTFGQRLFFRLRYYLLSARRKVLGY